MFKQEKEDEIAKLKRELQERAAGAVRLQHAASVCWVPEHMQDGLAHRNACVCTDGVGKLQGERGADG